MLIVIRDGEELSPKASFVVQLFKSCFNTEVLYVFRKEQEKFREKWGSNQIELATSTMGIFVYFFLMLLKTSQDIHDGIIRRLTKKNSPKIIIKGSVFAVITQALYQYFARSARTYGIKQFLKKLDSPKIFLIDEFWSLNSVNLKMLKQLGPIIYVSQDLACDALGFGDNIVAKKIMYKLERKAMALADVIIACSERDRLKYAEMGAKNIAYYPNIYPITEFTPCVKDKEPSISIVLRGYWGPRAESHLRQVFRALAYINRKIKVYMIGTKPQQVPRNVKLQYYNFIPRRLDYFRTLSKSWIGINIGIHIGGTNQRKYDYAMAGLVVLSDGLGARGELLPYEYTYVDSYDLAAKLKQLLELGKDKIAEKGMENRKQVLSLAERQRKKMLRLITNITRLIPSL